MNKTFDGMPSNTPNNMPWSDTVWSNAAGQESITLDHHIGNSPNMVLSDNDNSNMPDSDIWSNHPGFLWGTWFGDVFQPGKAKERRKNEAITKINARYPITGSCDLLTLTSDKVNDVLDKHSTASKRGPKRVAKRETPILQDRLSLIDTNRDLVCAEEAEAQAQQDSLFGQIGDLKAGQQKPGMPQTTTLAIGGVVLLGLGFLFYKALAVPQVIQAR